MDRQNVIVVASVGSMQYEGSKLPDKMIGCVPDLYMGSMGDSDISECRDKG